MLKPLLIAIAVTLIVVVLLVFGRLLRAMVVPALRIAAPSGPDYHAFTLTANDGSAYDLARHRGQVVLLVNTASKCGFTGQYDGLEALWKRFGPRGLVVIGVPTNDFLRQEPGTDAEIAEFCRINHGVTFPLMRKVTIRGPLADPLYRSIQQSDPLPGALAWNFEKCLIDRHGRLRARISPRVPPDDPRVVAQIEALLAED